MKHQAPIIDDPQAGPGFDSIAEKVVRNIVSRNPLMAAVYEEMEPEVQGLLKEHLGNQNINLASIHAVTQRGARIVRNAAQKIEQAKGKQV